jgi:hypothetical protein
MDVYFVDRSTDNLDKFGEMTADELDDFLELLNSSGCYYLRINQTRYGVCEVGEVEYNTNLNGAVITFE